MIHPPQRSYCSTQTKGRVRLQATGVPVLIAWLVVTVGFPAAKSPVIELAQSEQLSAEFVQSVIKPVIALVAEPPIAFVSGKAKIPSALVVPTAVVPSARKLGEGL